MYMMSLYKHKLEYICLCEAYHIDMRICVYMYFCGHLHCVQMIYHFTGANVHAETATKDTAITYACANGHTNVAALLLDYGADLVCVRITLPHHYIPETLHESHYPQVHNMS